MPYPYSKAACALGNELQVEALAHELRSIYIALDYAICRECSLARASDVCGGCTKHFLLETLAELADSLDGRCTFQLVQGVDIGLQLELDQRVNRVKPARSLERRRKTKRTVRGAIAGAASLDAVKSAQTDLPSKGRKADGVLVRP